MKNKKIENVGFHHVALSVKDFDKSLGFYVDGLGFTIVATWGEGEKRAAMLDIGNGSHFEIFAGGSNDAPANERFLHFAFSTTDPDSAYNNAIAAGAVMHMEPTSLSIPSDPPMPIRIAFVKGLDGELLEFFKTM